MASIANASAYAVAAARRMQVYTAEQLQVLTKPSFVNNRWRGAALNARAVKALRQAALIKGEDFPIPKAPTWNDKLDFVKPPKGRKFEALKIKRLSPFVLHSSLTAASTNYEN
jgi:hypothetical protein